MTKPTFIDLYSDTQTRPSAGMRRAMAEAEVGDEQRGEDVTTRRLEERVAAMLGKEAAVFLPSGTMCNQIAMLVHCRPGDEILGAEVTHLFTSEAGGAAALAGAQTWPIRCARGVFTGGDVVAALRDPSGRHNPRSRVVVIEQTVNRGGGAVWKPAEIADVASVARRHGLAVHMDGARLMNAVVASGLAPTDFTRDVDSVWLDLTKGLGCPVGAVLAGSADFIREAWRWKHRIGGALRQSGVLAAAGLYALDHHVAPLAEDHAKARRLADAIAAAPHLKLSGMPVETNIVYFAAEAGPDATRRLLERLTANGIRMGMSYGAMIRAVTHRDVSLAEVEHAAKLITELARELAAAH